jgi:hypothetical protein
MLYVFDAVVLLSLFLACFDFWCSHPSVNIGVTVVCLVWWVGGGGVTEGNCTLSLFETTLFQFTGTVIHSRDFAFREPRYS